MKYKKHTNVYDYVHEQVIQIYDGGFPIFRVKAVRYVDKIKFVFLLLLNGFWAIPGTFFMRMIRPILQIRVGTFHTTRIGHFAPEVIEHIGFLKTQPINTLDLFWLPKKTSNEQWAKMARRSLPIFDFCKYLYYWNRLIPGGKSHTLLPTYTRSRDIQGFSQKYNLGIPFLQDEETEAKRWLHQIGWKEGEPFFCLLVRDNEFLSNDPMTGNTNSQSYTAYEYHNFRDSDIATYVDAMEWLTEQGVWVFRMGKIMGKRIPSNNPRIVDYAFDEKRNALLDIWLFANCQACITTSTGLDVISAIYRKPLLVLNFSQPRIFWSWCEALHVPKVMSWKDSGKELNCTETWENSFYRTEEHIEAGIEISDASDYFLKKAVQEFWSRHIGDWKDTEAQITRNEKYLSIFSSQEDYTKYHGFLNERARIASCWLDEREDDFFI